MRNPIRRRPLAGLLPAGCLLLASAALGEESPEAFGTQPVQPVQPVQEEVAGSADESDASGVNDPWEGLNRAVFSFNETLDRYFLEPVATGWDFVVPEPVQRGIDNFFENLGMPRRIANDLFQGKPAKAGEDFGRFLINTTFGLGGFFDPASAEGYSNLQEDFGQTLGVWGVPPGPYLVLPILGPSGPRDTGGLVVENFVLSPERYFLPFYVNYATTGVGILNQRSLDLEDIRAERKAAFDFYAAVRNAYTRYRANQVRDRADDPEEEDDEDLYYFDDE